MATHIESEQKGKLIRLPALREAMLADRDMNTKKHIHPKKVKAKATISPDFRVTAYRLRNKLEV